MTETKQGYLEKVLKSHRMTHIDKLMEKYEEKRKMLKEDIESEYSSNIYSPMKSGSFAKHTAINVKFDLDLVVPFKKKYFDTLEKMFDNIHEFLSEKYENEATIRKQKVSIGLEFIDEEDVINLDIVPGRELNEEQYTEDNKINLYVNSPYGLIEEKTYLQTNINAQIEHIKAKENERKIIRLLKIWKTHNIEKYKSFLIELVVIKAFEKEDINGNLWEKLKKVMEYIRDNIKKEEFTLKDPGNSGNNVMDTLDSFQRINLSDTMDRIIKNIEDNKDNIKLYFKLNEEFEEESETNKGYGLKTASVAVSTPPNNTRFG